MALSILELKVIRGNLKSYKVEEITYGKLISGSKNKIDSNELLEYFLNQYDAKLQACDFNNNSITRFIMGIYVVLKHIVYTSFKADNTLLDRVERMSDDYEKCLETNDIEETDEVKFYLDKLSRYYNSKFAYDLNRYNERQQKNKEDNDELVQAKKTLLQKEEKIKELEDTVAKLQKEIDKKEKYLTEVKKSNETLKQQKEQSEKDGRSLEKGNATLQKKLDQADDEIASLNEKVNSLLELNKVLEKKVLLYEQKEKVIAVENQDVKKDKLQGEILKLILENRYTLDELVEELNKRKLSTNKDKVFQIINLLKKEYVITGGTIPKSYKIGQAKPKEDLEVKMDIPQSKCIDILLMADEHIETKDNNTYDNFDGVYNYCINNKIHTILHLGDFVDLDIGRKSLTDKLKYYMKDISLIINNYPKDKNITNVYLGGNHEKRLLICGIDPVEYVEEQRSDFISIGYSHAILSIGNDKIGLHHPNEMLDMKSIKETIPNYLSEYYRNKNLNQDDVYLDILGHYHRCYLNQDNHYFLTPSFNFNNESINSACHLKIYFDEKNNIIKIGVILLPTIGVSKKLMPAGELEYKKLLRL